MRVDTEPDKLEADEQTVGVDWISGTLIYASLVFPYSLILQKGTVEEELHVKVHPLFLEQDQSCLTRCFGNTTVHRQSMLREYVLICNANPLPVITRVLTLLLNPPG